MQLLASKYCLVFIVLAIVLLSFKFGGEHENADNFEQMPRYGAHNNKNAANLQKQNKNNKNLITNCDFSGIEQISTINSPLQAHQIIMDAIARDNIRYGYSAGQLYTLAVIESSAAPNKPFSYLCFLAINIPENAMHKGVVVAKYKKSLSAHLKQNALFKIIAYRQSTYLRGIEPIQSEKIRNDWDLQAFIAKHKLFCI